MHQEQEAQDPPAAALKPSTTVEPAAALRPGRADAVIVLLLWAGRRAFWPLLLVGLSVAVATGGLQEADADDLSTTTDKVNALLSPLAGVAAAALLRIGVGWLALLAAWPLSRWPRDESRRPWTQVYHDLIDRWRLAQAYRSLRWTWGVRAEAIRRAGRLGRRLSWAVPLSTVANILAAAGFVITVSLQPVA